MSLWTTQSVSALPGLRATDRGGTGDDPDDAVMHGFELLVLGD
jgi:hypothetical protein